MSDPQTRKPATSATPTSAAAPSTAAPNTTATSTAATGTASAAAAASSAAVPDAASATKYSKYAVLYVDDEEQALKYFRKGMEREFQVLTATNVPEALAILERDHARLAVVITDQRMPGPSGTDLLAEIRQRWPSIIRILTTAYSEIDDAIKAVNTGAVFKYLTKPVDFGLLRDTLKSAVDLFLSQGERDAMLQIKMSSLRRLVVADRVASLSNMSYGLVQHMRNSLTAMCCFLDEADPALQDGAAAQPTNAAGIKYPSELWQLASEERDRLLQMLDEVQGAVRGPTCHFNDLLDAEQLISSAVESLEKSVAPRRVEVDVAAGLGKLKLDAAQVRSLLKMLAAYVMRHSKPESRLAISARATVPLWNTTALQVFVTGEGDAWTDKDLTTLFVPFAFPESDPSERGLGLVSAFSIAHQHGGDIIVHRSSPLGPGFELLLPLDPAAVVQPEMQDHLVQVAFA